METTFESVTELKALSAKLNDDDVDNLMNTILKMMAKPDVPPARANELIVELQAMSGKFSLKKIYYKNWGEGADERKKKDSYYSLEAATDRLVDALKYVARKKV